MWCVRRHIIVVEYPAVVQALREQYEHITVSKYWNNVVHWSLQPLVSVWKIHDELSHVYEKKGWAFSQCLSEIDAVFSGLAHLLSRTPYWFVDPMDCIQRTTIHRTLSKKLWSATHCSSQSVVTSSRCCFCSTINDFSTICEHSFHIRRSSTIINCTVSVLLPSAFAV